ncbi:MAG: LPS assembly protein LptD [Granulosicoccus sp.]
MIASPDTPVEAEADRIVSDKGVVSLEGNTTIDYLGRQIFAENAKYTPDSGEVLIDGSLRFRGQGILLDSENARFDLRHNLFETGQSIYEIDLNGNRATGSATGMARTLEGKFELNGATYSTCPPGDKSWYIRADSISLDPEEGIGTAKKLTLNFKGVPIMAIPAFSFPISPKRKTGFLAPIFARSDNTGFELHIPWYWNIRPNIDATFIPRVMSKRGTQLRTELRYLSTQGIWTLDNEYLNDSELNYTRRAFTQLNHAGRFDRYWSSRIKASRVSDKDYFLDLGNSLELASITHLEQRADLIFDNGPVTGLARLQSFQTVDAAIVADERPYRRLPQLTARVEAPQKLLGIKALADAEFVFFDRTDSTIGSRIDIQPRLTLPVQRDAWFFKPSWSHRFTYYNLTNSGENFDSASSRNLDTLSIDGGLFFDRALGNSGSIQTLEPRAFYLRVPYQDQSDIPLFDSSAFDFNISQLFRENRFSGSDRVADANQLSLALTSRFINGLDGRETLRASMGQIFYFNDRRVSLSTESPTTATTDTRDTSDFVGELSAEFKNDWRGKSSIQWNPDDSSTVRGSLQLSYRPADGRIINLGHRVVHNNQNTNTEQLDMSVLWPIGDSWRIAGRWNYSLDDDVSIESLVGLEYDSCCWALRFAARRYISDEGRDHENNLYLQLVLKGLAPVGQNYGALLENAILGYRDEYQ